MGRPSSETLALRGRQQDFMFGWVGMKRIEPDKPPPSLIVRLKLPRRQHPGARAPAESTGDPEAPEETVGAKQQEETSKPSGSVPHTSKLKVHPFFSCQKRAKPATTTAPAANTDPSVARKAATVTVPRRAPWPSREMVHVKLEQPQASRPRRHHFAARPVHARGKARAEPEHVDPVLVHTLSSARRRLLAPLLPRKLLCPGSSMCEMIGPLAVEDSAMLARVPEPTAFDRNECGGELWCMAYAPQNTRAVLGNDRAKRILRQWLALGRLRDAGAGAKQSIWELREREESTRKRRRRRRSREMDRYEECVSDDTDAGSATLADERMDVEADALYHSTNFTILCGPSGCGKSALVHAVARELGYEVMEINPGSRRSHRDITKTVLETSQSHTLAPRGPVHGHPAETVILLEEADVLFDEDRGFWTGVESLITTSKRPIIITCSDTDFIYTRLLDAGNTLQLTPPRETLVVPYLQAMCLSEGHAVEQSAISSLYRLTQCDLRASICTLQFWCQMGVADPKAGLSWYPSETSQGQRTVSEYTFRHDLQEASPEAAWQHVLHDMPEIADGILAPVVDRASSHFSFAELQAWCEYSETVSFADLARNQRYDNYDESSSLRDERCGHGNVHELHHEVSSDVVTIYTTLLRFLQSSCLSDMGQRVLEALNSACRDTYVPSAPVVDYRTAFSAFVYDPRCEYPSHNSIDGPLQPLAVDVAPALRNLARNDVNRQVALDAAVSNTTTEQSFGRLRRSTRHAQALRERNYLLVRPDKILASWTMGMADGDLE